MNGIQEVSGSIPLISTKRKALKPLYINGFRLFLIFENLLQNESVNKKCQQIQKNFVVSSFFFALSTIYYLLYYQLYYIIYYWVQFLHYPLQLSFLGVCRGQFSEMLFIQKCPVRGLKSFRHEIILPYFFRGVVGQKIAKNATF